MFQLSVSQLDLKGVHDAVREVLESALIGTLIKLPIKSNVQILDEDLAECKGFFQSTTDDFGKGKVSPVVNFSQFETSSSSDFILKKTEKKSLKNGLLKKKPVLKTKAQAQSIIDWNMKLKFIKNQKQD